MKSSSMTIFNTLTWQEKLVLLFVSLLFLLQPFKVIDQRVAVFALCGIGVWILCTQKKIYSQTGFWKYVLIAFLLVFPGIASVFGTHDVDETKKFIYGVPLFFALGVSLYSLFRNRRTLQLLMGIISIVSIFCIIDAVFQFFVGFDLLGVPKRGHLLTGPFGNAHMFTMLTVSMPITLKWLERYGWKIQVVYAICLGMVVFMSDKRTEWVTFVVGASVFFLFVVRNWKESAILLFGLIALVVGVFAFSPSAKKKMVGFTTMSLTYKSMNNVFAGRGYIYATAINMGIKNPVNGVGAGAFEASCEKYQLAQYYPRKSQRINKPHAHHPWLEVFAETGFLGIFSLLAIIAFLVFVTMRSTRRFNLSYYPWFIMLALMLNPLNSMPPLFKSWWIPLVLLAIIAHLADVEYEDRKIPT